MANVFDKKQDKIVNAREIDNSCATIVSMVPYTILERKPGLYPGEYLIPKAKQGELSLLIVSSDVHYLVNPDILSEAKDIAYIKVPVKALEAAQSIIQDYVSALIGIEADAYPGLFAVKGDYTDENIVRNKFSNEIEVYSAVQNRWFQNLVNIADDIWSKTKSPQGISDIQRDAARSLGLDKEWLVNIKVQANKKCPFCGSDVFGPVCASCKHIVDKAAYEALQPTLVG